MSIETVCWGVKCKSCFEPVVFDVRPYRASGVGVVNLKPGAIDCVRGHKHIYFPRDFHFFSSMVPPTEEIIEQNCATYIAINPSCQLLSEEWVPSSA
jgi:hypothetical protein